MSFSLSCPGAIFLGALTSVLTVLAYSYPSSLRLSRDPCYELQKCLSLHCSTTLSIFSSVFLGKCKLLEVPDLSIFELPAQDVRFECNRSKWNEWVNNWWHVQRPGQIVKHGISEDLRKVALQIFKDSKTKGLREDILSLWHPSSGN